MSLNMQLAMQPPPSLSGPLPVSLPLHILTSQISVLSVFRWDWNTQTFSHGLLSGLTETR